jgi:hypothetical protein
VLYSSNLTMRWPYYVAAGQLAAAALLTLIAALIQHLHVKALTKAAEEEAQKEPSEPRPRTLTDLTR